MGAGLVIFFWLVLAGIYGIVFLVLASLWFWGRKRQKKWLRLLAGIPALAMATVAVLVVAFMIYGILDSKNPRSIFKREFGRPPPASVSEIQSSCWWFADTGNTYLRFKATKEAFEKLVPVGLERKTVEEMKRDTPGESGEVPTWWDYQIGPEWICYLRVKSGANGQNRKGFDSETEYFVYNPATHVAYYHFIG